MAQVALQIEDGKFGGVDLAEARMKADQLSSAIQPIVPDGPELIKHYQPMHFAKKKLGRVEIKTEVATKFTVVNMRNAYLLGLRPMSVQFNKPAEFNLLYNSNNLLTSDRPVEIHQQFISFYKAQGHVLVGGLGLGMAATMILHLPGVKSVTVVERNKTIINLVQPQLDPRIKVVHADLYKFLKTTKEHFDYAYHDIWYSCGERDWVSSLVPLYRLSQKAGINNLGAWGEFEMQAQLRPALFTHSLLPPHEASSWKPYEVFIKAAIKLLGQEPPFPESSLSKITELVQLYLTKVGTPEWEKTFDWEAHAKR
jgi:hypothetical protein